MVHFMRNALVQAGKSGRRVVSAFIATAFAQDTPAAASTQWRSVADQIRPKVPKLATLMDSAEQDVLAYMTFHKQHWAKLQSTNLIERRTARSSNEIHPHPRSKWLPLGSSSGLNQTGMSAETGTPRLQWLGKRFPSHSKK